MTNDRQEFISTRLGQHFSDPLMRHDVVVLPDDRWDSDAPADPSNTHRPYGWVPPFEIEVGRGQFWFCPERIARQTEHLSDAELESYLDIIQYVGDAHIIRYHIEDPAERVRIAEEELLAAAPGSYDLLNKVQFAVLDKER